MAGVWLMARTDPRPNYGSGRRVHVTGYIDLWRPGHPLARSDGYVFEHRLVAYEAGLLTDPELHIHHRNGDKADNRLENLAVMTCAEHAALHNPRSESSFRAHWERLRATAAQTCRTCAEPIIGRRSDAVYCSSRCRVNAWKREHRGERHVRNEGPG
jgi:hypothetical protein